ncbi:MAG: class I SAM-dependent methyltransferase [Actinomycetota bacterium]|nr:class I SAM-dependent methyltransferase [Actinomycetota bacterium]
MNAVATQGPRLYGDLASWFHLLTPPEEYAQEAEVYRRIIAAHQPRARTMLELGSGGGNNASHLKAHFGMTLVDLSPAMLDLSRSINRELEHIEGDMRAMRLGREFDAVFVHDAIDYMTEEEDLAAVMETAFVHTAPGGMTLLVPDHLRETFRPGVEHGGQDGEARSLRNLEWTWDPDPTDDTYLADFAYLLREEDGRVRVEHDRHVLGLFARERWLWLLGQAGFKAEIRVEDLGDPQPHEIFVATRPNA